MKYLPITLQIIGSLLIVAGVATYQMPLAVILGGVFLILFGVASENRGK
jgi:chemotaxis protein histidine kinase CheA